MALLAGTALAASPARARAEPSGVSWDDVRLGVTADGHFGSAANVGDVRLFLGWHHVARGADGTRRGPWFLSLGLTAGAGMAYVSDSRGIDGVIDIPRQLLGPEARAGVVFGAPARPVELYLAVAALRLFASSLTSRLPEAGGAFGLRAAAGVALPRSWWSWNWTDRCHDGECLYAFLFLLLPNTLELASEEIGGAWRLGGALGYSF